MIFLVTLVHILSCFGSASNGTPLPTDAPDPTSIITTDWESEPANRGTFRLLVTCLITLTLCVWTAIHLNIPPHGSPKSRKFKHKTKWVLLGLFAPELVAYTAWKQWNAARQFTVEMNAIFDKRGSEGDLYFILRTHKWTNVHSYYALMGGFVIDSEPKYMSDEAYIPNSPRLTLGLNGILLLAEHGNLPDISPDAIQDRSKADNLAKGLVCVQAGWMIVDAFARAASHLPVTLLEINTIGHVLCALVMYILWWEKPLEVNDPTVLESGAEGTKQLYAFMFMTSHISIEHDDGTRRPGEEVCEFSYLKYYQGDTAPKSTIPYPVDRFDTLVASGKEVQKYAELLYNWDDLEDLPPHEPPPSTIVTIHGNQTLGETQLGPDSTAARFSPILARVTEEVLIQEATPDTPEHEILVRRRSYQRPMILLHLDLTTVVRWELASEALRLYSLSLPSAFDSEPSYMTFSAPNWPGTQLDLVTSRAQTGSTPKDWSAISIGFASALYAGVHATAWDKFFPSAIEQTLWKISVLILFLPGFAWALAAVTEELRRFIDDENEELTPVLNLSYTKLSTYIYRLCEDPNTSSGKRVWLWVLYYPWRFIDAILVLVYNILAAPFLFIPEDMNFVQDIYEGFILAFWSISTLVGAISCTPRGGRPGDSTNNPPWPTNPLRAFSGVILLPVYCVARAYILLEAFLSIRELPIEAYKTPQWTQFIPHL